LNLLHASELPQSKDGKKEDRELTPQQKAGKNVVLGDPRLPPEQRPHRVALCEWPATNMRSGDTRTDTIQGLFSHVKDSGYDGVEMSVRFLSKYFPGLPDEQVAVEVRRMAEEYGLRVFGTNASWLTDSYVRSPDFSRNITREAELVKLMGGEYMTFQIWLPPHHLDTGGEYRRDTAFLKHAADVIALLHDICHANGINCYIETHVARISEDPQAFCNIMDLCKVPFEVNGDLSHYQFRNIIRGSDLARIRSRMGHTHQRMARAFGDLSVEVKELHKDWRNAGVTWQAFQISLPGLKGGLSSRVIGGESGPMHLVTDPLTVDACLVPLYRAMACYADKSARGQQVEIKSPKDVKF